MNKILQKLNLTALLIASIGCTQNYSLKSTLIPHQKIIETTPAISQQRQKPLIRRMQQSIDDIIQSGYLDSDFITKVSGIDVTYSLTNKKTFWNGKADLINRAITLIYVTDSFEKEEKDMEAISQFVTTPVHELAHLYFDRLPLSEQVEFMEIAKTNYLVWKKIQKQIQETTKEIGDKDRILYINALKGACRENGMPSSHYLFVESILKTENDYRKYYGDNFENSFYGHEIFAYIAQKIFVKTFTSGIIIKNLGDSAEDEIVRKGYQSQLNDLEIPPEMVKFFRGFLKKEVLDKYTLLK